MAIIKELAVNKNQNTTLEANKEVLGNMNTKNNHLRMRKIISIIIFCIFMKSNVQAQMNGWPLSSHASDTITTDQIWCTARARIISMIPTSGTGTRTVTLKNFEGSFTNDEWVMVIQMHQSSGNSGKFTMCKIMSTGTISSSITGNTNLDIAPYVSASSTYTNSWPTFSFSDTGEDILQIVKIQRYWNLTVSGGIISCPAFNYKLGTGGILAVMVGNQFTMTGGYFNVTAKGFHVKSKAGLGVGGNGAAAALSYSPTGSCAGSLPGIVEDTLIYKSRYKLPVVISSDYGHPDGNLAPIGGHYNYYLSDKGDNGGLANNPSTIGSGTFGCDSIWMAHSNYSSNKLHLGCSGSCGLYSASGGGGGGFGGTGGAFYGGTPTGSSGIKGENGKNGGNAGDPGIGGGILYLKLANSTLSFSNNQKRFVAKASNGGNGGNGGDGGNGGPGGIGAAGGCNSAVFVSAGGIGGYGDGGKGGDGGMGGTAGCGGTIWILKKTGGTHSNFGSFCTNKTGKAGAGGSSGYKFTFTKTPRPTNYGSSLATLPCNTGPKFDLSVTYKYCPPVVCDCDEVFRHLGADMATDVSFTNLSGSLYEIKSITKPSEPAVYWEGYDSLYYTKVTGTCATKYLCRMAQLTIFSEFKDKIFGIKSLESYNGSGNLNSGLKSVGMNGLNTRLFSTNGYLIFEYEKNLDKLTDFDDLGNPYVTAQSCYQTTGKLSGSNIGTLGGAGAGAGAGTGGIGNGGTGTLGGTQFTATDEVPFLGEPTGNKGYDGYGLVDGDYYEDETTQGPSPLKDQTEFNSLNNQKNEQDIRLSHRLNILSSHTISELDSASKNINPFREVKLLTQFNELIIQNPKSIPGRYKILNSLGQTIKTGRLTQDEISINLKAGIYFVSMYNGNSQITSKIYIDAN